MRADAGLQTAGLPDYLDWAAGPWALDYDLGLDPGLQTPGLRGSLLGCWTTGLQDSWASWAGLLNSWTTDYRLLSPGLHQATGYRPGLQAGAWA
jgi:hypothetical protein